jgi:phosphinothricin acetyltransferase
MTIRAFEPRDAASVARIYNHYVLTSIVTFEEAAVADSEMAQRLTETTAAGLPAVVAERDRDVIGFAFASKWKGRCAYRHSAEISAYLAAGHAGRGIGSALYDRLLPLLERHGVHAIIAGIALPNPASVALHEKFGLRQVAHFKEVGFKLDQWIDVGYWQRILGWPSE